MLFNTVQFFAFFAVVLVLFYTLPRIARKPLLLIASYFFYASWNPYFIPLLLTLTLIDYTAGLWLERVSPSRRKLVLLLSLAANLGFLGFFKYYNFAAANLATALGRDPHSFYLDIVLPLGISFHTFQSMSYVVDIYRGEQRAVRNLLDYALFICFFPQLVAGPIVRARDFFRDLLDWHAPTGDDIAAGLFQLLLGLTKKMALADQFAKLSDTYFRNPTADPGLLTSWSGVAAFGMQIFFDFSGYTDMAIGMAKLLGFHFPENFRRPYLAASITEFWRRWHISLSTWLRDYLYIPLGGNRHGELATYRNLLLTMLLGGLWHGASWNFVIWGAYHGTLLALERAFDGKGIRFYPLRLVTTFALVLIGWVFFRAAGFEASKQILSQMFSAQTGHLLWTPAHFLLAGIATILAFAEEHASWTTSILKPVNWRYASAVLLLLTALEFFGVVDISIPFIYFQF